MSIMVNYKEITDEEVFNEMQYHHASTRAEATNLAAKSLVVRELLIQEAVKRGFIDEKEVVENGIEADDKRIQRLMLEVIKIPQADEVSCQRFYNNNKNKFVDSSGQVVAFSAVRWAIEEYLTDSSWQIAVRQYIKILAGQARISGINFENSDLPLTQ